MSNGSFHTVTTDIILDDTIVDADIKSNANITRTKMNEAQDILIKTGAKLQVNDAANAKNVTITQDGTDAKITGSSGGLIIDVSTALVKILTAGVNNILRLFGSGGVKYIEINHDNIDGNILTQAGNLNLNPAADIYGLQNLRIRTGKEFYIYDATNTNYLRFKHEAFSCGAYANIMPLYFGSGGGDFYIALGGVNQMLRVCSATEANQVQVTHNNIDGKVTSTKGRLILSAESSVDFNSKELTGIYDLKYDVAKTRHLIISGMDFVPADGATNNYLLNGYGYMQMTAAGTAYYFMVGLTSRLPVGAEITDVKMYYYQTNINNIVRLDLLRSNFQGTVVNWGNVQDQDIITGYSDNHVAIAANCTVMATNNIWIYLTMDCEAALNTLFLCAVDISYTVFNADNG